MFRRLTPSRSAYGGLSKACVPFGIWGLLRKWVLFAIRKPAERCAARGLAEKCALFGVWRPVEARILCGVGRKRRNGARLHEFGNVLPGNATMGPFLGQIFFGFLFGKIRDLAFC